MSGFRHEALLYADDDEFLAGILPFIREGTAAGEAVLVAVPERRLAMLRAELDGGADAVRLEDMARIGRNPARIIPVWRAFVDHHAAAGRAVRGVGEPVWPGRSGEELEECRRHEALLNLAFAEGPAWTLLCPYHRAELPGGAIADACRTHPHVAEGGATRPSGHYEGPGAGSGPFDGSLPDPPAGAQAIEFSAGDLRELRRVVASRAVEGGLDGESAQDLIIAVSELAANSVRHAGGRGRLYVWSEPDALLCEVRDPGRIADPLAGRRRAEAERAGGRGLWLVNHLCDLVQIRSSERGSVIRLRMSLARGHDDAHLETR